MNLKLPPLLLFALFLLASSAAVGVAPAEADEWQELHPDSSHGSRFGGSMVAIDKVGDFRITAAIDPVYAYGTETIDWRLARSVVIDVNTRGWNKKGFSFFRSGDYESAVECFDRVIEQTPDVAVGYNNRGAAYFHSKEYERAVEDYSKVIERMPDNATSYVNRGNAYFELKEYESAVEDYNKAIKLNPKDAVAYNNRENAYSELGEYERAIEGYNKAIESEPGIIKAYGNRELAVRNLHGVMEVAQVSEGWRGLHPDDSPPARFGHSMVNINGNVYLFGGLVPGNPNPQNDLWEYDAEANNWSQVFAAPPPPARHSHAATVADGNMYISGGIDGEGNTLDDMYKYSSLAACWERILAAGLPPPRSDHSLNALPDGRIVLIGGMGSDHTPLSDTWVLDTVASSWTQGADFPGPYGGAYGASTAVHEGNVYVYGSTDDVHVYDVISDRWVTITPGGTPPPNRVLGTSAQVGSSTVEYLFGGEDENGNILSDIWEFDYGTNTWTQRTDMPVALSRSAAATFESQSQSQHVLLFGGLQSNGKPTNRTFVYIPEAEECVPGIEVNKTVFNETAGEWVDAITAELNETVRFRCVVHNNGTCCNLTDIAVTDILSDSLEYRNNVTVDGVAAEPTAVSENKYKWKFAGPLAPCEAITIEFDACVIECGNDTNTENATAWCEETGTWVYNEDTVWVNCTPPGTPVETATGSGMAYFATDAGTNEDLMAINESTLPAEGKPTLAFPHGFFSFNITGLTPGANSGSYDYAAG